MTALLVTLLALVAALAEKPQMVSDDIVKQYEERTFVVPGSKPERTTRYRLLKPLKVEAGKQYPVVLYLHGAGERGDDNINQLKYFPEWMTRPEWREKYPCYLIAPQCPEKVYWSARRRPTDSPAEQPAVAETDAAYAILQSLLTELPIDQKRIYLTGLSMGGYGSWSLAAEHPQQFAAVVPICGGGKAEWAEKLKDLPLWAVHGGADNVVPVAQSRTMIEALKAAGANPHYTELDGVGHDSWTPAYNDPKGPLPWMFEQHK